MSAKREERIGNGKREPAAPVRVAIVGRPNVGKSTLFNRLLGRKRSITLDEPGVTRDPILEPVEWRGTTLDLVDTGGIGGEADIALADRVHEHTVRAIGASDLLVVLFDAKAGLSPLDSETVDLVLKSGLPAIYVANKGEGRAGEEGALEFCALGIDPPIVVSAEHGVGIRGLQEEILEQVRAIAEARGEAGVEEAVVDQADDDEDEAGDVPVVRPCRVALVGRPNVGKSSFLNLVAGETLSLVDNKPGTTRDVVDTTIEREGRRYVLLDTAGMRRPSRVERGIEKISVRRSLDAIERADVVALLVEPEEGVTDQDARIARHAWDEGRALVLLVNKADLTTEKRLAAIEAEFVDSYRTLAAVPVGRLSVLKGRGVAEAFALIDRAHAAHNRRLPTPEVNRILGEAGKRREPPVLGRGRVRLFYGTQTAVRPPTVSIFTNRTDLPEEYTRFLERCFREHADFAGTPLRLRFVRRDSHGGRDAGEARADHDAASETSPTPRRRKP